MSKEAVKYTNVHGRPCYASRSDFAGSHAEIATDGVIIRGIGITVTVPFHDIDWLIAVLKDVQSQKAA